MTPFRRRGTASTAENGSPIWKNGPQAVDGASEAAGYLKAADPSEINLVSRLAQILKN